jgi:hypothetical protein
MFKLRRDLKIVFFLLAKFWLTNLQDGNTIEMQLVTWMIYTSSDNVLSQTERTIVWFEFSIVPLVKFWVLWNMTAYRFLWKGFYDLKRV